MWEEMQKVIPCFLPLNNSCNCWNYAVFTQFYTLIKVVEGWLYALDQGFKDLVCVVFFDISKAFDTVPYLALLRKLQEMGLNPYIYLIRWIKSYLCQWSQYVCITLALFLSSLVYLRGQCSVHFCWYCTVVSTVAAESDINMLLTILHSIGSFLLLGITDICKTTSTQLLHALTRKIWSLMQIDASPGRSQNH